MADSLKTILADRLNGAGDRIEWQPPIVFPGLNELREAEAHLGARCIPITKKDFVLCMLALRNMLAIPDDDQMTWDARIALYWTGLNDHPADLMETAVNRCIKTEVFFPKVAVIRGKVADEFRLRHDMLRRAEWLIANWQRQKPKAAPFVHEPLENIHRAAVWRGWHYRVHHPDAHITGQLWRSAIESERWLARHEGREPASWALPAKPNADVVREVMGDVWGPVRPPPPAPAANAMPPKVGDIEW